MRPVSPVSPPHSLRPGEWHDPELSGSKQCPPSLKSSVLVGWEVSGWDIPAEVNDQVLLLRLKGFI